MLDSNDLLLYLSHATQFGGGDDVAFDDGTPTWSLDATMLTSGLLDADMTRDISNSYSSQCTDVVPGERPVPVVVCTRWLECRSEDKHVRLPLLLIPAILDMGGLLHPNPSMRPWIPWERLASDGTCGRQHAVCTLDAWRAHQVTMDKLPDDGSWKTLVIRSHEVFDAINGIDSEEPDATVVSEAPVMRIWDCPDSYVTTSKILSALRENVQRKSEETLTAPLRTLFGSAPAKEGDADEGSLPTDELTDSKLLCGVLDVEPQLSANDRSALMRFVRQHDGSLLAMHAPVGTNQVSLALSAAANYITECALRGERAPVVACFASDSSIAAIEKAFAQRPATGLTTLPSRWLPRIAQDDTDELRVLGPVPTVCMQRRAWHAPRCGGNALETIVGHPLLGDAGLYSDSWYVPKATTHYLDCVSSFLDRRIREASDAQRRLSERLRRIDQDRCELIDAYSNVCHAAEVLTRRDELLQSIIELRTQHHSLRQALERWSRLASENPVKMSRRGHPEGDQKELIAKNTRLNETIPNEHAFISDICTAYQDEILRVEERIEELRDESSGMSRRVRMATEEGQRCVEIIGRLQLSCGLSFPQAKKLKSTIDGNDVSMQKLDDMLDQTVRPAEFWLAVHIYEAQWLMLAQRQDGLRRALCAEGIVSWRAISNLCPMSVARIDSSSVVTLDARGSHMQTPIPPFDLAIVLDGNEMDVATGVAILGHAGRALVLGTQAGLGARQPQGATSDKLYAPQVARDAWEELLGAKLAESSGSSLASALFARKGVPVTHLQDISYAYGELNDLRGELCPEEVLRTMRTPSSVADDPTCALLGIIPSLSHVLVPDSSWQQVGASRVNRAEALAIVRWLKKHGPKVCSRYDCKEGPAFGVVSAYREQAELMRAHIAHIDGVSPDEIEVVSLREAHGRTWPVVIASATCGPLAYEDDCACDASSILCNIAACARDALLLFWGGTWLKTDNKAALVYLRRAVMVGRLYSVVREGRVHKVSAKSLPKHFDANRSVAPVVDLRAKPISLTALLRGLHERGDLPQVPGTSKMNVVLERVGLIEQVVADGGHNGWRPTPAGREIGILATTDRRGNPFCSYAPSATPVIASTALTMLESQSSESNEENNE